MTDTLEENFPEAAPYIQKAIAEHGEEWVLENYYEELYPLSVVVKMPDKDELPFYDADEHEAMTDAELREMYHAWGEYRKNLRRGTKSSE